jgi:hypothetical protein
MVYGSEAGTSGTAIKFLLRRQKLDCGCLAECRTVERVVIDSKKLLDKEKRVAWGDTRVSCPRRLPARSGLLLGEGVQLVEALLRLLLAGALIGLVERVLDGLAVLALGLGNGWLFLAGGIIYLVRYLVRRVDRLLDGGQRAGVLGSGCGQSEVGVLLAGGRRQVAGRCAGGRSAGRLRVRYRQWRSRGPPRRARWKVRPRCCRKLP